MLRRLPALGGKFQPVTGGVEQGETFFVGAIREAREETGFETESALKTAGYRFTFQDRFTPGGADAIEEVFYAVLPEAMGETPDPVLDQKEHDGFEWVPIEKVSDRLEFENQKLAFAKVTEKLS
jgi:dATP pyrophosphohydrolase